MRMTLLGPLLLLLSCGGVDYTGVPDAGTPCSCEHVGARWYNTGTERTLAVCEMATEPPCDAGACVYFGECSWVWF